MEAHVRMVKLQSRKMEVEAGVDSLDWKEYFPHSCVFVPIRAGLGEALLDNKNDLAVSDMSRPTLLARGGTVKCVAWIKWKEDRQFEHRQKGKQSVIDTMMVAPVDVERNMYRGIGCIDLVDDDVLSWKAVPGLEHDSKFDVFFETCGLLETRAEAK